MIKLALCLLFNLLIFESVNAGGVNWFGYSWGIKPIRTDKTNGSNAISSTSTSTSTDTPSLPSTQKNSSIATMAIKPASSSNKLPAYVGDDRVWVYGFENADFNNTTGTTDSTITQLSNSDKESLKAFDYNLLLISAQKNLIKKIGLVKPKSITEWLQALEDYKINEQKREAASVNLLNDLTKQMRTKSINSLQIDTIVFSQADYEIRLANLVGIQNDLPIKPNDSLVIVKAKQDVDKYNLKNLKTDLLTTIENISNKYLISEKLLVSDSIKKCKESINESTKQVCPGTEKPPSGVKSLCENVTDFNKNLSNKIAKFEATYLNQNPDTSAVIISYNDDYIDSVRDYIQTPTQLLFKDKNNELWKSSLIACTADLRQAIHEDEIDYSSNIKLITDELNIVVEKAIAESKVVDPVELSNLRTQLTNDLKNVISLNGRTLTTIYLREIFFANLAASIRRSLIIDQKNYSKIKKMKEIISKQLEGGYGI